MNDSQKDSKFVADGMKLVVKIADLEANHKRLRLAAKAIGQRKGTCWCGVKAFELAKASHILHTVQCDELYLALYGAERGE